MMKRGNYLWVSGAVLILDHLTKLAIVSKFELHSIISIIPGFFRLVRVENRGIAFGMFSESPSSMTSIILVLVSLAAIALVVVLLWQNPASAGSSGAGLALILGGAAGNLLDRLARGYVVDFFDFYIGSYHWPAFNVADGAICVGAALLLWDVLVAQPARHRAA